MGKRRGGLRDDTKRVTSIVMIRRCFQAKRKRVHPCHRTARHPTHTRDITIDYEASAVSRNFPASRQVRGGRYFSTSFLHCSPAQLYRRRHDMTTIWRPHPLVKHVIPVEEEVPDDDVPDVKVEPVADDDGINGKDEKKTDLEGKGAKRKRAPPTKGPCEHGVKQRSKCKVCGACPHGRQRSRCKECGGAAICEHGRDAVSARSAVVHQSASTVVSAQMQGVRWVCNLRARSSALSVQGVRWVINLRARSSAL